MLPITEKQEFYSLEKIVEIARNDLRLHDELLKTLNRPAWQADYSLHDHHDRVRLAVLKMSRFQNLSARDIFIAELSAQFHDYGKIDKECWGYRRNRKLSLEERINVDKHAKKTGEWLKKIKLMARPEDHEILEAVQVVSVSHHHPHTIRKAELRRIGFNLLIADNFVSRMELRHRPALSELDALAEVEKDVNNLKKSPDYSALTNELDFSFYALAKSQKVSV